MKTLSKKTNKIEVGMYAGSTLGTVLDYYGKRAFLEILKYYYVSDDIMKAYHCHIPATEEEKKAWELKKIAMKQNKAHVKMNNETNKAKPNAIDIDDIDINNDDALNTVGIVELDSDSWETTMADYKDTVLYDSEDDEMDSRSFLPPMSNGWAYPYGEASMWNYNYVI